MPLPVTQAVEDDDGPEEGEIEDDEDDIILVDSSPLPSSTTSASRDVYPSPGRKESYERDIRNFELRRARSTRIRRAGGSKSPYSTSPSLHGNDSHSRIKTKHPRTGLTQGKENRHVRYKSPTYHRKVSHDRAIADFKDISPGRDSSCSSIDSMDRTSERISHQRPTRKHRYDRTKRRASSSPESSYISSKRRPRQSHHSTKCPLIKVLHSVAKETRLIALETSENHTESSSLRQRLLNMGAMPALRDEAHSSSINDENGKSTTDVPEESRSNSVNSSKAEDSCKQVLSESTQTDETTEEMTPTTKLEPEIVTLTDSEDGVSSLAKTPNNTCAKGSNNLAEISNTAPPSPPQNFPGNLLDNNSDDNDDDDIGRLRLLALQSKKQEQQESNPLDDGDVLQLRIAALKTSFMSKFKTRKKLPVKTRASKEGSISPLDDIPLPYSPSSPSSPDEVIAPVDMELAETDDEEASLHSMSRYSPSDPIPDCYSPSDDPFPVCYSPSDPTGSPTLERSIQELLPPPPPPDFDLYFPDPMYETPLQGISIDNSYPGCFIDQVPGTEICAPPPLPSYFRELLSGRSKNSSTLTPLSCRQLCELGNVCLIDTLYQPDVCDQPRDISAHMQENVHCSVPEKISVFMQPVDTILKHSEDNISSFGVCEQQTNMENFSEQLLVINEQTESRNECPSEPKEKDSILVMGEKDERENVCPHPDNIEKQVMIDEDFDATGNVEEPLQATPNITKENEEISLEEEEKLLRQRLLLNLANKRAKLSAANHGNTVQAPSKKNVLPDVVPNRSNLILIHPINDVKLGTLGSTSPNSKSLGASELPVDQSSKQKPSSVLPKASRPKSALTSVPLKSKSLQLGEPSKTKPSQLVEPSKLKAPQLVIPLKPKSTQLAGTFKGKSTQLKEPLRQKSTLVEPSKQKSIHLADSSKSKSQQVAVSSQTCEDKKFIIYLGEDSDSNDDYSEAEALGQKCVRNREKWLSHLKELDANPVIKGLPPAGSKLPLRMNLNPKQTVKERNPRKPFAENLADLENSVERFLKGVRSSHEARAGKASSSLNSTPVAVKHLPVSQQEEYRRLKQQIAQLEKLRESSSRQQKLTSVAVGVSKSTQVATRLNISKETMTKPKISSLSTSKSSNASLVSTNAKRDLLQNNVTMKAKTTQQSISNATQKQVSTIPTITSTITTNLDNRAEIPQNKEGLLSLQSTVVTERSHVLKELSSLAKLLAQVDKSLEAQSHTATEVSSLIDKLCLAAGRWRAQNRTVASLVQKVALRQKVISSRNRSCVAATKTCVQLGNQLYGNSYRIPLNNADSMRLQLKQVHEKTQELAKRRTTEQAKKRLLEKRAESCLIKLFSETQNPVVDKGVKNSHSSIVPLSPLQNSKEGKSTVSCVQISASQRKTEIPESLAQLRSAHSETHATSTKNCATSASTIPHINSALISRAVSYRLALNKVRSAKTVLNTAVKKRLLDKNRKGFTTKRLELRTKSASQNSVVKDDLSDMDISTDGEEPGKKSKDASGNTDVVDMSVSPDTSLSPPVTEQESYLGKNIKNMEVCDANKNTAETVQVNKQTSSRLLAKNIPKNVVMNSAKTSKNVLKNYVSPLGGLSVFSNNRSETSTGNDLYAILCPYDLNGKCQDLECPYKHQHR
ncbi:Glyceraldehyde-3-phosphate dehydrogenase 3 [Frankliniella fusca]|uniref:Glyceraldehyde-3-phosphate dehydrogenase 3 n=1 Tax=Frankliniella fusca TaxID=407009 RepID=A0AAE1H154_9NEOP|nr:Glyceraldehyde-3-phosphate dehydrogenase 3 [Frankliniella fusca]